MTQSSRRDFLAAGVVLGAGLRSARAAAPVSGDRFTYCLNTSTIRGQKLGLAAEIDLAASVGYDAIEPWVRSIHQVTEAGGSPADLRKRLEDRGLALAGAIAFVPWIVDDPAERAAGLEQARRDMDAVARLGGTRMAAPPAGAQRSAALDLDRVAERYRALLDLGRSLGVTPMLEVWGFATNLTRLAQAAYVALAAAHPDACLLLDAYHLYKGGSDFGSLRLLGRAALPVFHLNDYPADPPRETITDRDRVFPGEGVAPLTEILATLHAANPEMVLSLELFNPTYWQRDAREVATRGLASMKRVVDRALAPTA